MAAARRESTVRHLRIFISSPGDVPHERQIAREVVERLGRDAAFRNHLKLDPVLWDDPEAPAPMLAGLTPQESVNRGLVRPSDCDIVVTIFWGRMGTPLEAPRRKDGTPYLSGTEWEFEDASRKKRDILLYRRTAPVVIDIDDPELEQKRAQKKLVTGFFDRLKGAAGAWTGGFTEYDTPDALGRRLESDLRNLLPRLTAIRGVESRPNAAPAPRKEKKPAKPSRPEIPAAYRDWLKKETGSLELLGLGGSRGKSLFLSSVYVPLVTTAGVEVAGQMTRISMTGDMREQKPLLLHALGRQSLYVQGAPGSGKSTFCNWVAWLACEGSMPPADVEPPEEFIESFPQALSGKLPVLVRLRDFWPSLPLTTGRVSLSAKELVGALNVWLSERTVSAAHLDLGAFLEHGALLAIFDGVDEVPTAFATAIGECNPRKLLLTALAALVKKGTSNGGLLLVTSRPYGLSDEDVARLGLTAAPIADLSSELQGVLVRRWFRIQRPDAAMGDASAADLVADIGEREWLRPLAANPLMLTAMCAIYSDGGKLPQDRHQLYDRIVDCVLTKRYEETNRRNRVRFELDAIAHAMHTGDALGVQHPEPLAQATFTEAELALRDDSAAQTQRDAVLLPKDAREDLLAHSGLLTGRGHQQLGFYHLSIQEFLAAERIFELRVHDLQPVFLERGSNPGWRNTLSFLFGRYMSVFTVATRPIALLNELAGALSPDAFGLQLIVADCAEMLAAKNYSMDEASRARLQGLLLESMTTRGPARERCEAGMSLGKVGDSRFDPAHWFLPTSDEAPLGFLQVEAGEFVMGSDPNRDPRAPDDEQPAHTVDLREFFIARYPVTVAQFKAFVRDAGYEPGDRDRLEGIPNHPVARVSWHHALAYCRWLTEKLRSWTNAPEPIDRWLEETVRNGWELTLPSEAEWEKAARGTDGRIFPWGDTFDENQGNFIKTGIGRTSAVGAFPGAKSPYGAVDMSGNVWEWTRSLWGKDFRKPEYGYPYRPDDEPREALGAGDDVVRVVRGGSFFDDDHLARAACRNWYYPLNRFDFVGVRVVVIRRN